MTDFPRVEKFTNEADFITAFDLYIDFKMLDKEISDEVKLEHYKLTSLKYALKNSPVFSSINTDGRSTYARLKKKLSLFFPQPTNLCNRFFKLRLANYADDVNGYLVECKNRAILLLGKQAKSETIEKVVMEQVVEQFQPAVQMLLRGKMGKWSEFIDTLKTVDTTKVLSEFNDGPADSQVMATPSVPQVMATQNSSLICYNCERSGHTSRKCKSRKVMCNVCSRYGHRAKYCLKKNSNSKARGFTNKVANISKNGSESDGESSQSTQ